MKYEVDIRFTTGSVVLAEIKDGQSVLASGMATDAGEAVYLAACQLTGRDPAPRQ